MTIYRLLLPANTHKANVHVQDADIKVHTGFVSNLGVGCVSTKVISTFRLL